MEQNINIAEILRDMPKGTKLYSPLFGEVKFEESVGNIISISTISERKATFWKEGKYFSDYLQSECLLFPSKEMRDWNKFAWKKGDVLLDAGTCSVCIFDKWNNDEYTEFNAVFITPDYGSAVFKTECWHEMIFQTDIQQYISKIEKRFGGKLNRETLEIEKPEFKDGDIVVYGKSVAICRKIYEHTLYFYTSLDEAFGLLFDSNHVSAEGYRFASDSEKQQLFDALKKEGKAWDAEKKQIVDLPKKCEFQPFEKVLVRYSVNQTWRIDFFERMVSDCRDDYYKCMTSNWRFCIHYEGNEHLLGTINNVED